MPTFSEPKYETCPECNGEKVQYYSCCTGDIVDSDIAICPDCKEHLGEEDCHLCDGEGKILDEQIPLENETDD